MTKIDIISGFLGAGKTTLIKKLIGEAFKGEKVVLVENEFGEIGIDGGFLQDAGVNITEMNSGCICCSLVGDFEDALQKVVSDLTPDRVIIEPSGVGKLSDVIKAVEKAAEKVDIVLNSATTVVDVTKAKMYIKNFGEFFLNQIEACGTVVLSRTQGAAQDKLLTAVNMIREHNDKASIITTPWDEIDGQVVLDAMEHATSIEDIMKDFHLNHADEEEHEHHHHHDHDHDHEDHDHEHHHHHHDHDHECDDPNCSCHHHHHADDVFTSWGKETAVKYDRAELEEALKKLAVEEDNEYGIILRAKGIIPDADGKWMQFDLVPGEWEIRDGKADYTGKLCVIGSELKEDKIAELFKIQ